MHEVFSNKSNPFHIAIPPHTTETTVQLAQAIQKIITNIINMLYSYEKNVNKNLLYLQLAVLLATV